MRKLFAAPETLPEKKGNSKDEGKQRADDHNTGKKTQVFRSMSRNFERRVKSELFLEDSTVIPVVSKRLLPSIRAWLDSIKKKFLIIFIPLTMISQTGIPIN